MDWAAELEHLQTVFRKFEPNAVILEPVLICLFRNGLWPSIHAQAKQKYCQKDTWDQAIKKAITTKDKTALNIPLLVREIDVCCFQGYRSASKPTKDHTRDQVSSLFRFHKAQAIPSHYSKPIETETPHRDYWKTRRNRNYCNHSPHRARLQGFTLAIGVNTIKTPAQNNHNRGRNRPARSEDRDLSWITCHNCNKKCQFANQYPEPRNSKN